MDTTKIEQYIQDLYDGKIRITEVPYKYRNHDTYMAAHIFARTIADDTVRHDQYWKIASQLEDDVIQSEKEKDKEREENLMYTHRNLFEFTTHLFR